LIPFVPIPDAGDRPSRFPTPFDRKAVHPLARRAAEVLMASLDSPEARAWRLGEPGGGKMFGVLVVEAPDGRVGWLRAFSGMLAGHWELDGWAPPTFDRASRDAVWIPGEAEMLAFAARREALVASAAVSTAGHRSAAAVRSLDDARAERSRELLRPILTHMLEGLPADLPPAFGAAAIPWAEPRVLHEDVHLMVVHKPAGLLTVPGRSAALQDCVVSRLRARYPEASGPLVVHRLDLDTSGLVLAAKDLATASALQRLFSLRQVEKRYVAVLDGAVRGEQGHVTLPLRVDVDDRPRNIHDPVHGKPAHTEWCVIGTEGGVRAYSSSRTPGVRISCGCTRRIRRDLTRRSSAIASTGEPPPTTLAGCCCTPSASPSCIPLLAHRWTSSTRLPSDVKGARYRRMASTRRGASRADAALHRAFSICRWRCRGSRFGERWGRDDRSPHSGVAAAARRSHL